MHRRRLLAVLAGATSLVGCTGRSDDLITALAVNRDDATHAVSVRVARDGTAVLSNAVEVAGGDTAAVGDVPWRAGRYRVTAEVDGEAALERTFRSGERFNQLDVVVESDGSVALNRGRAA